MQYKTILFDADMTLFDFHASEAACVEQTLREYGYPCAGEIVCRYSEINDSYWKLFEQEKITREELVVARFAQLFREIGVEGDPLAFNQRYMEYMGNSAILLDGASELCQTLCKTYRLYMITNGNSHNQRRRLDKSGLKSCFQDIFISEEIGSQKPQIAFFDYIRANIPDWDARSTLVVGDSLTSDIQGAINYGLDCCWFNPKHLPYTLSQPCTYEIHCLEDLKIVFHK